MTEQFDLEDAIRLVVEQDMGDGSPLTPRELAQYKVEIRAHDAKEILGELVKLRNDPLHKTFFSPEVEVDLWKAKNDLDFLITGIRIDNGEEPLPRSNVRMLRNA